MSLFLRTLANFKQAWISESPTAFQSQNSEPKPRFDTLSYQCGKMVTLKNVIRGLITSLLASDHEDMYKMHIFSADVESIPLDGRLWYMKSEQQRMKTLQMKNLAKRFKDLITEQTGHKRSIEMKSSKSLNGIKSSSVLSTVSTSGFSLT